MRYEQIKMAKIKENIGFRYCIQTVLVDTVWPQM